MRWLALLFLTLASSCFAQDDGILATGFEDVGSHGCHAVNTRQNLAISIAPPAGGSDLKMRLVINALPAVKGKALTGALIGQRGSPPYVYSIAGGSLPAGIALDAATGLLSGTPTTAQHYTFLAEVQDSALGVYHCTFSINVLSPLTIVAGTPPPAEHTVPYSYQFKIGNATGVVTWSNPGGGLPSGILFDSINGTLYGTPDAPYPSNGTVIPFFINAADDGTATSIDIWCTITWYESGVVTFDNIGPANDGSGGSSYLPPTYLGVPYSATVTVTGGVPPYQFSDNDGTLTASGFVVNTTTGEVTGTVNSLPGTTTGIGGYNDPVLIEVIATDSLGALCTTSQGLMTFWATQVLVQPAMAGSDVGDRGPHKWNFSSDFSVANAAGVVDISLAGGGGGIGSFSVGAFGSTPNSAGASYNSGTGVLTLQPASATQPGGVTTGAQTFAGAKTFSSTIIGDISGNAATATGLATGRTIAMTGPVTWSVSFDGSGNVTAASVLDIDGRTAKTTPVGADEFLIADSAAAFLAKKITFTNLLAAIPTFTSPLTTKGDIYARSTVDARLPIGTDGQVLSSDSTQTLGLKWIANSVKKSQIPMGGQTQSTKYDSTTKLICGSIYFDPNDTAWNLTASSTITFNVLLATTSAANVANADLYQQTGTGSPVIVGTTPTTASTTAAKVSVTVSSAFRPGANAGIFNARIWITTANGNDQCTSYDCYLEITP